MPSEEEKHRARRILSHLLWRDEEMAEFEKKPKACVVCWEWLNSVVEYTQGICASCMGQGKVMDAEVVIVRRVKADKPA